MGRLEQEARDERVKKQQERVTVYSSLPYQVFMVHAIKSPVLEGLMMLIAPDASNAQRVRALLKIRRGLKNFEEKFPEPQKGIHPETGLPYVWNPNSLRLIEFRDEFFTHCVGLAESRLKFMRMGINFLIVIYDYDPPYRMLIDWWAKKLGVTNWDYSIPITINQRNWTWWKD